MVEYMSGPNIAKIWEQNYPGTGLTVSGHRMVAKIALCTLVSSIFIYCVFVIIYIYLHMLYQFMYT